MVVHKGSTYQAKRDTAKEPPHEDWTCLASAGKDARMPLVRGTYDETEHYQFMNIVALGGSGFIARTDNPGPCPGDGWQLIASAGKPGKPGPKGDRGEVGSQGPPGRPGAFLVGWKVDRASYTVTPIMSDGSPVEALQLRPLFEQYDGER